MVNIAGLLKAQLATPERVLYCQFLEGGWRDISAREIAGYAARWQQYLRAEGFARGDRIALCLRNGIHWVAADQAALGLGLVVVPLYVDDNPENVACCERTRLARPDDVFLSFLPLSHMFERTGSYYLPLSIGAKVAYARSVSQLAEDLASERPTVMYAVPRVFERFASRVNEALAKAPMRKRLFDSVVAAGGRALR